METKANHILIGAFLLTMLGAGFAFVYWLGNYGLATKGLYYHVLFEGPVTGLSKSSDVLFNGIRVGKVQSFAIDAKDSRKTRVLVTIRDGIPVKANSHARIESQGLTSFSAVHVTPGTPDSPLLAARADEAYPTIMADRAMTKSLFESAPEMMGNANALILRLNDLVANNERMIRKAIKNVEAFSAVLEANKDNIGGVLKGARQLTDRIGKVAERLDGFVARNEETMSTSIKQFQAFTAMLDKNRDDVQAVIKNARSVAARVDKLVADNAKQIASSVNNIETFTATLAENKAGVTKTVENVQAFSKTLADNRQHVATVLRDAKDISAKFKQVAAKFESAVDGFSSFSSTDGSSFMTEAREAVRSLKDLTVKLDRSLGDSSQGMTRFATSGLREFDQFMRDGRRTVNKVNRVLDQIEKNPQGFIFGSGKVPVYKSN